MTADTDTAAWTIARTVDEIEAMADALLDGDAAACPFYEGATKLFGGDAGWPLMVYCPKFLREGADPDPLDAAAALDHLRERVEFLIDKAEGERGISTPKAREQVNMLLWLFGREDYVDDGGFAETARQARDLQQRLPEAAVDA